MISYAPLRARMAREKRNFQEFRDHLKISPNAIAKLNNDAGYVALASLDKICDYLGCDLCDVAEHIKAPAPNTDAGQGDQGEG